MTKPHRRHRRSQPAAGESPAVGPSNRSLHLLWISGIAGALIILAVLVYLRPRTPSRSLRSAASAAANAGETPVAERSVTATERLVGRWQRLDGDYILALSDPTETGGLTAQYLNPAPINVGHAEWRREQSDLLVFVELRDVNYPGSTYALKYVPAADRLTGTYFQAAVGESFEVEFARLP